MIKKPLEVLQGQSKSINTFQPSVTLHLETTHLICIANQMTGFYMKCNTGLKRVNQKVTMNSSIK